MRRQFNDFGQRTRLLRLIYARSQPVKGPKWGDLMHSPPKIRPQEPAVSDGESEIEHGVKLEEVGASDSRFKYR